MAVTLIHLDGLSRAPLGCWWLAGDEIRSEYFVNDAKAAGVERVHQTFDLRIKNNPGTPPVEIWSELVQDFYGYTPGSEEWAQIDAPPDDPETWLLQRAHEWSKWRYGDGAVSPKAPAHRARYKFAARQANQLAAAVIHDSTDGRFSLSPLLPGSRRRISTRILAFTNSLDDVLIVAVGSQEPPAGVQFALPYALSLLGERELRLILPAGTEWPTLARLPWLDISARVWTHEIGDPSTLTEIAIPLRSTVLASHTDKLVTTTSDLGDREPWVAELIEWLAENPEIVTAHRPSYMAWHCRGRQVLKMSRTRKGLRLKAGVHSTNPDSPYTPGIEWAIEAPMQPLVAAAIRKAIQTAIAERSDGTDTGHKEHRFQARLANSNIGDALKLKDLRREFPAFRPGADNARRGYIDFLGSDESGRIHVVETKLGHDPMIALQALDYCIWADAHRSELIEHLGLDADKQPAIDLVVLRPQGLTVIDDSTASVLERLSRDVSWQLFEAVGDLDGDLLIEPVPRRDAITRSRWVDKIHRRVESAAVIAGVPIANGWFPDRLDGVAPGTDDALASLVEQKALHPYFGHVRSSQRYAVDLFAPLRPLGVARLLATWFGPMASAEPPHLEWIDPSDHLGEATTSHPYQTQVDVALIGETDDGRRVAALVEVKLTEVAFGGCSHAEVAPQSAQSICTSPGPFGGNPDGCWQLRNHDKDHRRLYDQHLHPAAPPEDAPPGCWFRRLNQPMRLAALSRALVDNGEFDETVVALTCPTGHVAIRRQWRESQSLLDHQLDLLEPETVAAQLPPPAQEFMTNHYGVVPSTRPGEQSDELPRRRRERLGWGLVAEIMRRHPTEFQVVETHPGGGQYDCLSMLAADGTHIMDLNREGSLHLMPDGQRIGPVWELIELLGPAKTAEMIDDIGQFAVRGGLPDRVPTVTAMSKIAGVMAPLGWTWVNGMFATSGYGGGRSDSCFDAFPQIDRAVLGVEASRTNFTPEQRFWFLVSTAVAGSESQPSPAPRSTSTDSGGPTAPDTT